MKFKAFLILLFVLNLTNFKALNCMTYLIFHSSQCIWLQKQNSLSNFLFYLANQLFSVLVNRFNFSLHNVNVAKIQIIFTFEFAVTTYKI